MKKKIIKFNAPYMAGNEAKYINRALKSGERLCGDGEYTHKCSRWLEKKFGAKKALITPSCTHALELAAILSDIKPGDEIIMPSFTFPSTANAFVLRGARIVFVDIRPDTMNLDEHLIEQAITERTKAVVPVHYAGVACEMDKIVEIAKRHGLYVIEDAAQGVMSSYKGRALGTIGNFGCYSFHETKNIIMGEGGAILINDESFAERAEIIREKGTNRSQFLSGKVDRYSWVDIGSSYLPGELGAAYLFAQLEKAEYINKKRMDIWKIYESELAPLYEEGFLELPYVPEGCTHNAQMYYIKCRDIKERAALISYLKAAGISAEFHYVPLHTSLAGMKYSRFSGDDRYTTRESERILRLPLHCNMTSRDARVICEKIHQFYKTK